MNMLEKNVAMLKRKGDADWLEGGDFIQFLEECDSRDDVLMYFNSLGDYKDSVFITSVFLKDEKKENFKSPSNWVFENGWDWYEYHNGKKVSRVIPKEQDDVEPFYFIRSFDGRTEMEGKTYTDVYQKVIHILDLHFVPHKKAYCLYDDLGDIVEVIKYEETPNYKYMAIKRKYLNIYLHACGLTLIKYFDCMRRGKDGFVDWKRTEVDKNGLKFTIGRDKDCLSMWGIKIVVKDPVVEEEEQYAEFKIYDFKNQKEIIYSCDPKGYCSYFNWNENDLPHDLAPAYFRPEVLNKYRNDPDKYTLHERHIDCKGWWLKSYDINDEGLVHVYMVDIAKLPYEEQLYWKSYNVGVPHSGRLGGISERAWTTDFEGKFPEGETLHQQLTRVVSELIQHQFWNIDARSLLNASIDENSKTWGASVAGLYNVFIHRMQENKIKQALIADYGEKESDIKQLKSIALLKKLFGHKGLDVKNLQVLDEVRNIRNACDSHTNQAERNKLIDAAKTEHSSLQKHYESLVKRLLQTMTELQNVLPKS
jgi:hypothetical protein